MKRTLVKLLTLCMIAAIFSQSIASSAFSPIGLSTASSDTAADESVSEASEGEAAPETSEYDDESTLDIADFEALADISYELPPEGMYAFLYNGKVTGLTAHKPLSWDYVETESGEYYETLTEDEYFSDYFPLNDVASAIGGSVSVKDGKITVTIGGISVSETDEEAVVKITDENGTYESESIFSILKDSDSDVDYISIYTLAEFFGLTMNYDSSNRTLIIINPEKLADDAMSGLTYETYGMTSDNSASALTGLDGAVTAEIAYEMLITDNSEEGSDMSMEGDMTLNVGMKDGSLSFDMLMTLLIDMGMFTDLTPTEAAVYEQYSDAAQTLEILRVLREDGLIIGTRFDSASGMLYIKLDSATLKSLGLDMGGMELWFSLDIAGLIGGYMADTFMTGYDSGLAFEEVSPSELASLMPDLNQTAEESVRSAIVGMVENSYVYYVEDYFYLEKFAYDFARAYSDDGFSYDKELDCFFTEALMPIEIEYETFIAELNTAIYMDGDKIVSQSESVVLIPLYEYDDPSIIFSFNVEISADGEFALIAGIYSYDAEASIFIGGSVSESEDAPLTAPGENALVLPLELLLNLTGTEALPEGDIM